jgi:hypothetical protein
MKNHLALLNKDKGTVQTPEEQLGTAMARVVRLNSTGDELPDNVRSIRSTVEDRIRESV